MKEKHEYLVFLTIFIIITIPGLWYNAAIRTDIAYLTFFALAAPFVVAKNEINFVILHSKNQKRDKNL